MTAIPSAEARFERYLLDNHFAIVPPRIARWLEAAVGMTADRRALLRHTDPEAYAALMGLHLSALRSVDGTKDAVPQSHKTESVQWVSTRQAADTLNVTHRCIRNWCRTGRLNAQQVDGRWIVDPVSINHEHTTRTKESA